MRTSPSEVHHNVLSVRVLHRWLPLSWGFSLSGFSYSSALAGVGFPLVGGSGWPPSGSLPSRPWWGGAGTRKYYVSVPNLRPTAAVEANRGERRPNPDCWFWARIGFLTLSGGFQYFNRIHL